MDTVWIPAAENTKFAQTGICITFCFYLVGTAGFEPATHGLKGRCSTD